jgi:hypothetical protein
MPRRSFSPGTVFVSRPSMRIEPLVGSMSRLIMRNRVDLPLPEVPTSVTIEPRSTKSDRFSTAGLAPK